MVVPEIEREGLAEVIPTARTATVSFTFNFDVTTGAITLATAQLNSAYFQRNWPAGR